MRRSVLVFVLALAASAAALLARVAPAHAAGLTETILHCDFDAEPLDEVIGTGGPEENEPVALSNIPATVRNTPLFTPCLEIADNSSNARSVRFEFRDDVEIVSGQLIVSMTLQFAELEGFHVYLRENGGSAEPFLNLTFAGDGEIHYSDLDSPSSALVLGTYEAATVYVLHLILDLDAREYDVMFDTELLRDDEPLGDSPLGIGAVLVGFGSDPDLAGTVYLDDLVVSATQLPTAVESESWGAIKARWR